MFTFPIIAIVVIFVLLIISAIAIAIRGRALSGGGSVGPTPTATLTARPTVVCREGAVTLQWTATGNTTTLSASPAVRETLRSVANSGPMTVHAIALGVTRITLASSSAGQPTATSSIEIQAIDPTMEVNIGGAARCVDLQEPGQILHVMSATVLFPAEEWSSSIQVHRLTFAAGTTDFFEVYHDSVLVLDEATTEVDLGGVPIAGVWDLRRPLQAADVCDEQTQEFRGWPSFQITASVACS